MNVDINKKFDCNEWVDILGDYMIGLKYWQDTLKRQFYKQFLEHEMLKIMNCVPLAIYCELQVYHMIHFQTVGLAEEDQ